MVAKWWGDTGVDQVSVPGRLTRTGNLIFGVGNIHRLPFRSQRHKLLRQAMDLGFRTFDAAPAYGNGLNELELGVALLGIRSECSITTKFGIPSDLYGERHPGLFFLIRGLRRLDDTEYGAEYRKRVFSGAEMVRSLEGSLKRLKRDYIDDFLIHEPLGLLSKLELTDIHEKACRMKEQGKILRWGIAGPATSIVQLASDPLMDVFQFPLEDLAKICILPLSRKIAYGVYRSYRTSIFAENTTFAAFVKDRLDHAGIDLIVASTSSKTVAAFRDCF